MSNEAQKMSIARALKEKERIARRLAEARRLFASVNSSLPDVKPTASPAETYEEMQLLQKRYLEIKKAIAEANAGISAQLTEMLVLRAEIDYYNGLNCQEESFTDEWDYGDHGVKTRRRVRIVYNTVVNEARRRQIRDELTRRLDDLQDEVDVYNATHTVDVPE